MVGTLDVLGWQLLFRPFATGAGEFLILFCAEFKGNRVAMAILFKARWRRRLWRQFRFLPSGARLQAACFVARLQSGIAAFTKVRLGALRAFLPRRLSRARVPALRAIL